MHEKYYSLVWYILFSKLAAAFHNLPILLNDIFPVGFYLLFIKKQSLTSVHVHVDFKVHGSHLWLVDLVRFSSFVDLPLWLSLTRQNCIYKLFFFRFWTSEFVCYLQRQSIIIYNHINQTTIFPWISKCLQCMKSKMIAPYLKGFSK